MINWGFKLALCSLVVFIFHIATGLVMKDEKSHPTYTYSIKVIAVIMEWGDPREW
jgi:hypothetical protein